jgi:hypothetical protein
MPQVQHLFPAYAILCEIESARKLAQTVGQLCTVRVVTAGAGSPNLIFTDNDDNELYEIDATNLVAGQVNRGFPELPRLKSLERTNGLLALLHGGPWTSDR